MGSGATMRELRQVVAAYAAGFDPALISPADAQVVVRDASAAENMLATIKAKAAARAAEGGQWRREGAPSPAHALARESGSSPHRPRPPTSGDAP